MNSVLNIESNQIAHNDINLIINNNRTAPYSMSGLTRGFVCSTNNNMTDNLTKNGLIQSQDCQGASRRSTSQFYKKLMIDLDNKRKTIESFTPSTNKEGGLI